MIKGIRTVVFFSLFIVLLAVAYNTVRGTRSIDAQAPVSVTFMPASEDADCIVIIQGKNSVLIDTGLQQDAQKLVAFLQGKGIDTIDCIILTHPDKDHIGGAPAVLQNFKVNEVIMPKYNREHTQLQALLDTIGEKDITLTYPTRIRGYTLGGMRISVYPPLENSYLEDNNYSLATMITHQNVNMLFTGDAKKKRMTELSEVNWPEIDLYKVNYHGRYLESSVDFIQNVKPGIAVITAHKADQEVIQACTDVQSRIFLISSGEQLTFLSDGNTLNLLTGEERKVQ